VENKISISEVFIQKLLKISGIGEKDLQFSSPLGEISLRLFPQRLQFLKDKICFPINIVFEKRWIPDFEFVFSFKRFEVSQHYLWVEIEQLGFLKGVSWRLIQLILKKAAELTVVTFFKKDFPVQFRSGRLGLSLLKIEGWLKESLESEIPLRLTAIRVEGGIEIEFA